MTTKRKICVVVASRANYGRIKSLLKEIDKSDELELELILSASALLRKYGNAADIIIKDGFKISASIYMVVEGGTLETMVKSTGMAIMEFASAFERIKPDIVLTVADRYETIATAISASYMNIPLAHTQGGELTGSIDESVRHAITKLSHIHFPATEQSKKRLIQMGEDKNKIFNYGCPSIDEIADKDLNLDSNFKKTYSKKGLGDDLDFDKPYIVVLQHSVTNEFEDAKFQILQTIEAIKKLEIQTIWLWPNIDAGTDEISKELRLLREKELNFPLHFFINLPIIDYAKLMNNAACFIGNSSSALREGAFLGVPSVNIGTRQSNRERSANVIDAEYNSDQIFEAASNQINHGKYHPDYLFGDGSTAKKMVETLKEIDLCVDKEFVDISF